MTARRSARSIRAPAADHTARKLGHNRGVPAPRFSIALVAVAWALVSLLLVALSRTVAPGAVSVVGDVAWAGVVTILLVIGRSPAAAVACGGGVLAALDLYAFAMANQGLSSLVDIGRQEGVAALRIVLDESGVGAGQIAGLFTGCIVLGLVGGWLWSRWSIRPVRWRYLGLLLGLALGVAVLADPGLAVPRILGHFWGPDRLIAGQVARRGELPSIPLPAVPPSAAALPPPATATATAPASRVVVVIVEALRADAIDPETTPHMARFAASGSRWLDARAAANATHPGWYAIMYGRWGHRWYDIRHRRHNGDAGMSPVLADLQHDGGVGAYSGARLDFYELSGVALGRPAPTNPAATDFIDARTCHRNGAVLRSDCDRCAIDHFRAVLAAGKLPRTSFVFFDGTHVPYDWPADHKPRFVPVTDADLLRHGEFGAHGIPGLKNRYRSALHAVDVQFGRMLEALDAAPGGERTLVILTGDHGEEFMEHGRLTHASELCAEQTRVPIIVRGPGFPASERAGMANHVDILPTVLRALRGGKGMPASPAPLDGKPLQDGPPRDWAMVVHAGATSPVLLALHKGPHVLTMAFAARAHPAAARALLVVDDWPRDRIADVFGDALRAVFGIDRGAILSHSAQR